MSDFEDASASKQRLSREQAIGIELRAIFGRLEAEPIPDALLELAAVLDTKLAHKDPQVRLALVRAETGE